MEDSKPLLPTRRLAAYLDRIGARRPSAPTADALRDLQVRHLHTVPFENLSIHLGEDVPLDAGAILDKLLNGRRGGFCYELNGAFALLLRTLGYRVLLLEGRVYCPDGVPGIPYDHLALQVEAEDGSRWLADVGFGDHTQHPLGLDDRGDQKDPAGVFRIQDADSDEGDLDVLKNGRPELRLVRRPRALADFVTGAWWHRTSPASHFTRGPVCSRLTSTGRVTLRDHTLITTANGERTEYALGTDAEVLAAYRDHFGITLDRLPVPLHPRGPQPG
ncbi:arylamine N-acetyltransferase [Streptomyces ficellus]|uniref:Arylamine N-acetyltransferase n=1 Tax=Streptomyces ficellus TaxID=1977088 RepID=A0ABT7ZEC4_9ACTN|nr:arylamine N-acetyltransferase [Streptomyces ficellus]MDN3297612.1 arylamine N-acetyltransferase [Streptomyces ficellus]